MNNQIKKYLILLIAGSQILSSVAVAKATASFGENESENCAAEFDEMAANQASGHPKFSFEDLMTVDNATLLKREQPEDLRKGAGKKEEKTFSFDDLPEILTADLPKNELTEEEKKKAEYFQELAVDHSVLFGLLHARSVSRLFRDKISKEATQKGVGGQKLTNKGVAITMEEFISDPVYHTDDILDGFAASVLQRIKLKYSTVRLTTKTDVRLTGIDLLDDLKQKRASATKIAEAKKTISQDAAYYDMTTEQFIDASRVARSITPGSEKEKYALEIIKETLIEFLPAAFLERTQVADQEEQVEIQKPKAARVQKWTLIGTAGLGVIGAAAAHFLHIPYLYGADLLTLALPNAASAGYRFVQNRKEQKVLSEEQRARYELSSFRDRLLVDNVYRPPNRRLTTPVNDAELSAHKKAAVKVTEEYISSLKPTKIDPNNYTSVIEYGSAFDLIAPAMAKEISEVRGLSSSELAWSTFIKVNNRVIQDIEQRGFTSTENVNMALVEPLRQQKLFLARQYQVLNAIIARIEGAKAKMDEFIASAQAQHARYNNASTDVSERIEELLHLRASLGQDIMLAARIQNLIKAKNSAISSFIITISKFNGDSYKKTELPIFEELNKMFVSGENAN